MINKEIEVKEFINVYAYSPIGGDFWEVNADKPKEEVERLAFATFKYPEGFLDSLKGLTIEEQAERYKVVEKTFYDESSYGEVIKSSVTADRGRPLSRFGRLKSYVVRDGVIIGALVSAQYGDKMIVPYMESVMYSDIENDGAGRTDVDVIAYMYCVTE